MDQQRNLPARSRRSTEGSPGPIGPEEPSALLSESRGWAGTAREATGRIDQGVEAIRSVRARHNKSGQ
jgi:hypothetical protein